MFAARILRLLDGGVEAGVAADAGELDQHRQVDAGQNLDSAALHDRNGQIGGRAPEHVGQDHDTLAGVHLADRPDDLLAALGDVVVRPDGDSLDLALRADDMLQSGSQLVGQTPMRHEHDSNHESFNSVLRYAASVASPKERHIVQAKARAQLGASTYPLPCFDAFNPAPAAAGG